MPQQHLLNDESSLNGLSEANVVGDQQISARHIDCADERIQLVVLNADAAAEWCLKIAAIRVRRRPPNHCIEEGLKCRRIIQASHARQPSPLDHMSSGLQLPQHFDLFPQRILVDRGQADEMAIGESGGNRTAIDLGYDPLAAPSLDQLARLWGRGVSDIGHRFIRSHRHR